MERVSVVIPVKDGERHLGDLLAALARERPDETLIVDSGSSDRSLELAAAAGVRVLGIPPHEFGHGRTRNLGAERTTGELICFLTQDAVPVEGWLAAMREAMAADERVGAAFGPHLPRPGTSPMIARELEQFFARFAADGRGLALQRPGDDPYLSNVNACYRRSCWEQIRFPDLPYAEDQAFGRAMLAAGWWKAFHPAAAVVHAHDYPPLQFMRRYFDEYRGLHQATGHVEPLGARTAPRDVAVHVRDDLAWLRERGAPPRERALWALRSAGHHAGRRLFSALGSRSERLPRRVQQALSLEGRSRPAAAEPAPDPVPRGRVVPAQRARPTFAELLQVHRDGPAPLAPAAPGMADRAGLHVAVVVPPFQRGSGGHATIFRLVTLLERRGNTCSIWVHDPHGYHGHESDAVLRRRVVHEFSPVRAPVFNGLERWYGADVAMATGWETVHPVCTLPHVRARAYLVNDHEPEFFPTSAERLWAEETYELGLHPISASTWLRDLLAERYGNDGGWFRLGVDDYTYRTRAIERRRDTVIFYARMATARRAVPLGTLALEELKRRRPDVRVVAFGDHDALETTFGHEMLGIATPGQLALNYCEATVGLCLSLTNYSLIPQEMMACGLPCVDVTGGSSEAVFGVDGPAELAAPDPVALADAMERLLTDEERWRRRSEAGLGFVERASWQVAGDQVEAEVRNALRAREREIS